jgi:flavin reductase (DIM6/NTAB) family NADH-FMN oxidoreductase RutF
MKNFPLSMVYQLLEPGPVVLVTTASKGRANVMAMSWHMMVEFTPPLIACIVSDAHYSFAALRSTKECVIAIPSHLLARKVVGVGNCSGQDTDKFKKFHLTPVPAKRVGAPLIADCFANLECKVVNTRLVNQYSLFVLEVVKAWRDERQQKPENDPPSRLWRVHRGRQKDQAAFPYALTHAEKRSRHVEKCLCSRVMGASSTERHLKRQHAAQLLST